MPQPGIHFFSYQPDPWHLKNIHGFDEGWFYCNRSFSEMPRFLAHAFSSATTSPVKVWPRTRELSVLVDSDTWLILPPQNSYDPVTVRNLLVEQSDVKDCKIDYWVSMQCAVSRFAKDRITRAGPILKGLFEYTQKRLEDQAAGRF